MAAIACMVLEDVAAAANVAFADLEAEAGGYRLTADL